MRPQMLGGLVFTIIGVLMLAVRSFTYFSHEQVVGPLGFFAWDVSQPHTIFVNPIAGLIALGIGMFLLLGARRSISV
jgi:hypothetical protein